MTDWAVYVGYQMVHDRDVACAVFLSEIDALEFVAGSEYERYYQRLEVDLDVISAWSFLTRHPSLEELTDYEESPIFKVIQGGKDNGL